MRLHGCPRTSGVSGLYGSNHCLVFSNGQAPRGHGFEVVAQPLKQRATARVPKGLYGFKEYHVVTGLGHRGVKGAVAQQWRYIAVGVFSHVDHGVAHGFDVGALGMLSGQGRDFTLFALCPGKVRFSGKSTLKVNIDPVPA